MPNQALFYPWIEIKDDQWLKTSLLYWDEFRTIVPESIANPYRTDSTIALESAAIQSHPETQSFRGVEARKKNNSSGKNGVKWAVFLV